MLAGETGMADEESFWKKLKWLNDFSGLIAMISALVASLAVITTVAIYLSNRSQQKADTQRSNRAVFLGVLQGMRNAEGRHAEIGEQYRNSNILGTLDEVVVSQSLLLLLQAENLLPEMEKAKSVTDAEYLVLAEHSLAQGFDANAKKYGEQAYKSESPHIRARVEQLYAQLEYQAGNAEKGRDGFTKAIRTYDAASSLLAHDRAAGAMQTSVTWVKYEMEFGDQSFNKAEDIISEGEVYLDKLRTGSLKNSGVKVFNEQRAEIKKRRQEVAEKKK